MYRTYKTLLTGVIITGPFLWSGSAVAASEVANSTVQDLNDDALSSGSYTSITQQVALQDLAIPPTSLYAQNTSSEAATPVIQLADVYKVSASSLVNGFDADIPSLETLLPNEVVLPVAQLALAEPAFLDATREEVVIAAPAVETASHMPDSRVETALAASSSALDDAPFYSEGLMASFESHQSATLDTVVPSGDVVALPQESVELAQASEPLLPNGGSLLGSPTSVELAQATENSLAQLSDEEIRQQLLTTPNPATETEELDVLDRRPQPIPSSSFITPNAYGADWGDFYIGSAGTTEDTDDGLDASASLGMGFGSAVDNVGVELNVGIISIDGFADDGSVGFKVHKLFPRANNLGVAVGWTNPITWGAAERDEDTIYGVVTQRFDLRPNKENPMPLTTSLGVGTGTFRSKGAVEAGDNAPNVFGSVGLRVIPQVSLVSSWSGRALGLAASAAPFNFPVVFTAGVSDLTDNTEEGTQFVGGLGYSFGF